MVVQAIYPTVIIALVNSHRTFGHMYLTNISQPTISHDSINPQHTTTIQFGQPNPDTSAGTLPPQGEKSHDVQEA